MNTFLRNLTHKRILENPSLIDQEHITKISVPDTDVSLSQRYFDTVFRYGEGIIGVENDLVVLADPKTPDLMKQYIQQHSARPLKVSQSPHGDYGLDDIMPTNLQTYGEVMDYIDNNDLKINIE